VLPLLGPSVPVMSSALGLADGVRLRVPRPSDLPPVTVYSSPLMTSFMVLRTSSGNACPPSSAVAGSQVPSSDSPLASPARATAERERVRSNAASRWRDIGNPSEGQVLPAA